MQVRCTNSFCMFLVGLELLTQSSWVQVAPSLSTVHFITLKKACKKFTAKLCKCMYYYTSIHIHNYKHLTSREKVFLQYLKHWLYAYNFALSWANYNMSWAFFIYMLWRIFHWTWRIFHQTWGIVIKGNFKI